MNGPRPEEQDADPGHYHFRLYVAGRTAKSLAAVANLKRVCEEYLAGRYEIEVIDLLQNPKLAAGDQILAIPTLVRRLPAPLKRIIGDLSNTEKVLVGLDIRAKAAPASRRARKSRDHQPTTCASLSRAARCGRGGRSRTCAGSAGSTYRGRWTSR